MESKNIREIQCEMVFLVAIESSGDCYLNSMKVKMAKKYVISVYSIQQLFLSQIWDEQILNNWLRYHLYNITISMKKNVETNNIMISSAKPHPTSCHYVMFLVFLIKLNNLLTLNSNFCLIITDSTFEACGIQEVKATQKPQNYKSCIGRSFCWKCCQGEVCLHFQQLVIFIITFFIYYLGSISSYYYCNNLECHVTLKKNI